MKKLDSMKPDQVCAWVKGRIRELFGDKVENKSSVWASHGYYNILLFRGQGRKGVKYQEYTVRRKNLPALMKELKK